jgi:hypothetical protein
MQAIHVRRYEQPHSYQGSIEPEDRSWVVFIGTDGQPELWRRSATSDSSTSTEHGYERVGLVQS